MAFGIKIRATRTGALAAALLTCALQGNALAAQKGRITAAYVVDVGSFPVLKISYDAALTGKTYQSTAAVKTKGIAGLFADYRMNMSAAGAVNGSDAKPTSFRSRAEKKDKNKTIELNWRDGKPPTIDPNPAPEDETLLAGAVTAHLVDPLSMILRRTALQIDHPCGSVERVFDGKEVYDLRFELDGEVTLGTADGGNYRGQAFKCSVTYTPIAGRAAEKFRKKRLAPPKFNIWFAPVRHGAGRALFVPVLATGKLKGLRFVAYASETVIDGVPLASAAAD